ncbi:class I SAM-dependent methyltransferase [uncultured Thiodictyon sp.]|uniref:class I SAM-dependent methyltransferase n=1 Tax=uncultured Thiodictyon sp. TaxID=1846217 RepID=UPI0025EAB796|nr:class I SAM-dependent methyltransferase [uncultured Thiodictyon sp.]
MDRIDAIDTAPAAWPSHGLEALGACPVCDHAGREPLLADLRDLVFGIGPGTWTLWRCTACGAGYLDPRPDRATIGLAYAGYYTQEAALTPGRVSAARTRRLARRNAYLNQRWGYALAPALTGPVHLPPIQQRRADRVVRSLPAARAGERLLDVGCGNGAWLDLMRAGGWAVWGVEPDAQSAARAAELGLSVVPDLLTAPFPDQHFDAITLNHVIEHLHDPGAALARCYALLKPGGRLWIATPNLDALGRVRFGPAWRGLETPRHLVLYTASSLRGILAAAGFESIERLPPTDPARGMFLESARIARARRLTWLARARVKWQAWRADRRVSRAPECAEESVVVAVRGSFGEMR